MKMIGWIEVQKNILKIARSMLGIEGNTRNNFQNTHKIFVAQKLQCI